MAQKTYRVISEFEVCGKKRGETIKAAGHPDIQFDALVEGGHVELVKPGDADLKEEKEEPLACGACKNEGRARPPKFDSEEELAEHYREAHPALQFQPETP